MLSLCRQTDGQTDDGKTLCPQSFDAGACKCEQKATNQLTE